MAAFQRNARKKRNPLVGMLVALASICCFLFALVVLTVIVHFIMM